MMLNISQKIRQTRSTFIMDGMAPRRAFTTTWHRRRRQVFMSASFQMLIVSHDFSLENGSTVTGTVALQEDKDWIPSTNSRRLIFSWNFSFRDLMPFLASRASKCMCLTSVYSVTWTYTGYKQIYLKREKRIKVWRDDLKTNRIACSRGLVSITNRMAQDWLQLVTEILAPCSRF